MLGLLGLRIFEATGADIADLGEEHGHRVLRVCGKGTKAVLVPLPPAVGRAIDRAIGSRMRGPVLLNSRGARMDLHAATRRLRQLTEAAGIQATRAHPHMLRHTYLRYDHARCWRRPQGRPDPRPARRPAHDHAASAGPPEPGPPPELHPRRLHGLQYLSELPSPRPGLRGPSGIAGERVGTWRGARGRRGQRAASGWEALTPTEIKIAALVAGGDSTSDIAGAMFVSRRTVQTYISRILAKLGAKGRVEIVREALRQGRLALAGRTNRRRCGKVSSHDHYSQPGAAGCLGLCPVLGTGQAAGRDMHRMTQPGLLWASVRRRRITSATLPGDAT